MGLGYDGAPTQSIASDSGAFRVHWATEGDHAPPLADTMPSNGVPDFVDEVAAVADRVADVLQGDAWRAPPSDESSSPNGGDDKYDIYLVNFGGSADGLVAANACFNDGTCSSHMIMENDFAGRGYATPSEGISVLVSHEYFHAIQYAYHADLPAWWSEGTATWFEEYFDPTQNDFERLVRGYFPEASRGLNARQQGFTDGWPYRTGIFPHFLELHYGVDVIRATFERLAEGDELLDALDVALHDAGASLREAFATFAGWNAFTGSRATTTGYPSAAQFDEVPLVDLDATKATNWQIAVDPLAAKYARVALSGSARIRVVARDGYQTPSVLVATAPDQLVDADGFETTETSVLLVVAGSAPGAQNAATIQFRNVTQPDEPHEPDEPDEPDNNSTQPQPEPDPVDDDVLAEVGGGCASAPGKPSTLPLFAVVALGFIQRRRRRTE